jgi:hypothetical protein
MWFFHQSIETRDERLDAKVIQPAGTAFMSIAGANIQPSANCSVRGSR